jgi:hypothetical protein
LKAQRFLIVIVVSLVLFIFAGFVVVPAITGKTLVELINPPRGGNIYGFTIKDINGDMLEVEVSDFDVSEQARRVKESGERKWVGGKLVVYDNEWGFRFDPDTIIIADVTAEGLQTTLNGIKEDLDYWMQFDRVYVSAEVTEVWVEHGIGRE